MSRPSAETIMQLREMRDAMKSGMDGTTALHQSHLRMKAKGYTMRKGKDGKWSWGHSQAEGTKKAHSTKPMRRAVLGGK